MRVLAGAANAETLDVALTDGTSVADSLSFAAVSGYVDVPAGPASLLLTVPGSEPTEVPVDLAAGSVYSLLVLDEADGLSVQPVLDAAGSGVVPQGGVETGAGGTAGAGSTGLVALGAGAAAAAGALALRAYRHRPRRAAHLR